MAKEKPWGGRFSEETDALVEEFTASVHFDQRLALYDIRGSIAHARMLAACGIIAPEEAARNSRMKSRSETASMLLAEMASKPSSRATISRSMGKGVPAKAALPRGQTFTRRRTSRRRSVSRRNIS